MRKITLLIASLFLTVGAMAQTFVAPVEGGFYKIKGDSQTYPWLTAQTTSGGNVVVSANEADAAIFQKTANGLMAVSTKKYLGYAGGKFTYNNSEIAIELRNTGNAANSEGKYAIVSGSNYMYNNNTDGIVHESSSWLDIERLWGFIECKDPFDGKIYALDSYMDYLYHNTNGSTDLNANGSFQGTVDTRALWLFEGVTYGVYNIKNVHTGWYVSNDGKMTNDANNYGRFEITTQNVEDGSVHNAQDGHYFIKFEGATNYNCLHSTSNVVKPWTGAGLGNQYSFIDVEEFAHTLTVGDAEWATLVLGFNATIPTGEGFKAYTVEAIEGTTVKLAEATGVLAANTPIFVNAPQGNYSFAYTTEEATVAANGKLSGTLYNKNISEDAYVLGNVDGEVGLYKAEMNGTSWLNNANKAYLLASAVNGAALSASLRFDFGGITAVEEVETEAAETVIYDLTGRRVNEITKAGVYVVNGKKVLVK